ncbi:MAG TPA: helix-turn-helix domain-containing protein [Pseudonocardia sp.]|uniref:helix-turn-helix domain-containing protein n=1 Tax=Pseudonocardia sp. TaxID=60912 RepID=UPI002C5856A2|nr:helix-turn-helix domain-containing protein [Pseudonocardia sp.]HTF49968.1 helix-turn-helix domain-containing protein [Pseudonocardia sp.]
MASASGTPVSAIARLVAPDEDTVRDVIHAFNERGLAALEPRWAGGRPRLISDDDIPFIARGGHRQARRAGCSVHALEPAQARHAPDRQRRAPGPDRARAAAPDPARARGVVPADQDMEGNPPIRTRTPSPTGSTT